MYEKRLGTKLTPVGYAYYDHLLLLASEDGRFLGVNDDFGSELGSMVKFDPFRRSNVQP
jgi:hypothetical protein